MGFFFLWKFTKPKKYLSRWGVISFFLPLAQGDCFVDTQSPFLHQTSISAKSTVHKGQTTSIILEILLTYCLCFPFLWLFLDYKQNLPEFMLERKNLVQDIGSWDFPARSVFCPQDLSFRVSLCSFVGCIIQLLLPHLHLPAFFLFFFHYIFAI